MAQQDPIQKIAALFEPMQKASTKEIKDYIAVVSQEWLLNFSRLEGRIDVLEKLLAKEKRTTTKNTTAKADTATVTTTAVGETPVAQPGEAGGKFPTNKLIYFRKRYGEDEAFRAKYTSEALKEEMKADLTIQQKTNPTQKLSAEGLYVWNHIKNNDDALRAQIEVEYNAAKEAFQANNKPAQQTVENNTPK